MKLLRYSLAGLVLFAAQGAAFADEPIMTLNVAVKISNLPGEVQKYMVNCLVTDNGPFAQGSTTGDVTHAPTSSGTYVGGYDGTVQVPLYRSGAGQIGAGNGYSCSLLLISGGQICSPATKCGDGGGGTTAWSDHKEGTPFTPTINGTLPAAN